MTVILIICSFMAFTGLILWALDHGQARRATSQEADLSPETETSVSTDDEGCCGMHITCEKDSLLASVSPEIVYYDDDELDRFAGRRADQYTDSEIEEFRDVLLTLMPDDIAGWGRSIQLRGIQLPTEVKEELLMIVSEARAARAIAPEQP